MTDGGKVTTGLLLLNVTAVADVAGPLNVTVQALEAAPESDMGVQVTALSVGGAGDTMRVAVFELPLLSVTVTVTEALVTPVLLTEN